MYARATGLFSIYRGTTTNASGDTIDDNTTVTASSVPMALHNIGTPLADNPNTDSPRTIAAFRGRADRTLDLRSDDRIKDESTAVFYVVDGKPRAPLSSTRNSDLQFDCHRVN